MRRVLIVTHDDDAHRIDEHMLYFLCFPLPAEMRNISSIVIGQEVGQNLEFREVFDVTVARAVAEMRILGTFHLIGSFQ